MREVNGNGAFISISKWKNLINSGEKIRLWLTTASGPGSSDGYVFSDDMSMSKGFESNDIFNGDNNLVFGNTNVPSVDFSYINTQNVKDHFKTKQGYFGLHIIIGEDPEQFGIPRINMGPFVYDCPVYKNNMETMDISAYASYKQFNKGARNFIHSLHYPITFEDIVKKFMNYCGVPFLWPELQFADALQNIRSRVFNSSPFGNDYDDITCRDLLSKMATACGTNYSFTQSRYRNTFAWFHEINPNDYSIDESMILDYDESEYFDGPITWDEFDTKKWNEADQMRWADVCGNVDVYGYDSLIINHKDGTQTVVGGMGERPYEISGNPFLIVNSQQDINDYIVPLYERLMQFPFSPPITLDCIGYGIVEAGDIVTVTTKSGTHKYPIYSCTMKWNGGFIEELYETTNEVNT